MPLAQLEHVAVSTVDAYFPFEQLVHELCPRWPFVDLPIAQAMQLSGREAPTISENFPAEQSMQAEALL